MTPSESLKTLINSSSFATVSTCALYAITELGIHRSTQWTHPRTGRRKQLTGSLPFGWEMKILDDGKVIYVDHENQKTTYTDPRLAFAVEDGSLKQSQFRQRFDASSTALQVLHGSDLSRTVAVVTGAGTGGIGFETARSLALHGATVVFACRTMAKATEAAGAVLSERARARCVPMQVELTSLRSVTEFTRELMAKHTKLDILVLNAGVFGIGFRTTPEDGLEEMFQVNFLSQFYLASRLKTLMSKSTKPRMVVVTSESHRFVDPSALWQNPSSAFTSSMEAYNRSKLLALMFALEAGERWHGLGVRGLAVHPGNVVCTGLSRHFWPYRVLFALARPFAKSLQQAASSVVFAACAPELADSAGIYVNNCFPCEPSAAAMDSAARKKCWKMAVNLIRDRVAPEDFDENELSIS